MIGARLHLYILIAFMFSLLAIEVAYPQSGFDIFINDDYSGSDQNNPRLAVSNSGDIMIIWTDKRYGDSYIFCQLLDSTGSALGYNQQVNNDYYAVPHVEPAIASGADEFRATWKDYRNGDYPFAPDIYFAAVDSTPTSENHIITVIPPQLLCESPDIGMFRNGNCIIVWSDYRYNHWDIFGQRVTGDGQLIGNFFRINSDVGKNQQHSPRVAVLPGGGFVVVWYDNRNGDEDIYIQRFDSSATPVGQNIRVNTDNTEIRQAFPAIAADGNGRFFVTWVDWINGDYPQNPDIYLKRYDSSATAIGSAIKVNRDDYGRPQKQVSLCSDNIGNICVVWADSIYGQWDTYAQIYDPNGDATGANFRIHNDSTGKQLQPDVAADGYKFYFVWADSRNGDFDIYAGIKQYNEPAIISEPNSVELSMERGGSLPVPAVVALDNAGYGALNWAASPGADWLNVTPSSGVTPDTMEISVAVDTLSYGTHYSTIRLIDLDHNDSSQVVSVMLHVTAPILDINPDTLYFKALAELGNPEDRKFQINNIGTGSLSWTAEENSDWFSINQASGIEAEYITIQVDISGLTYDDYYEPLIISSPEAINSPETSWVHLELVGNMPYLEVRPDSLRIEAYTGESFIVPIEIVNLAAGSLNWTAVESCDWIFLDKDSGSDYDTIFATIETAALPTGYYRDEILVYDSTSFNKAISIPVELFLSSGDTVQFFNTNAMPLGIGVMPVYIYLIDSATGGYIPIGYDTATATLDSILPNPLSLPPFVEYYTNVTSSGFGELGFRINQSMINDSIIRPGNYHIANLFFTAGDVDVFNLVDTIYSDSSGTYILGPDLNKRVPSIVTGYLIVGEPTSIDDEDNSTVFPKNPALSQNYPNPFNAATNIEISLPRAAEVAVDIYNILGQRVYILHNGNLSQGDHTLNWNGRLQNGHPAPSGIYFCRMAAGKESQVRKMVLLR